MRLDALIEKLIIFLEFKQSKEPSEDNLLYITQLKNVLYYGVKPGFREALAKVFVYNKHLNALPSKSKFNLSALLDFIDRWDGQYPVLDNNNVYGFIAIISSLLRQSALSTNPQTFPDRKLLKQDFSLACLLHVCEVADVLDQLKGEGQHALLKTRFNTYVVIPVQNGWIFYDPENPGLEKKYKNLRAMIRKIFKDNGYNTEDFMPIGIQYASFEGGAVYPSVTKVLESLPLAESNPLQERKSEAEGWTGLHMAVYCNCESSVAALIKKGANVNALDKFEKLPLWYTSAYKSPVAKLLVKRGCEAQGRVQSVPLIKHAIRENNLNFLKSFVARVDENLAAIVNSKALLCMAADYDKPEIVDFLISQKVRLDVYDKEGYTPLISAIAGRSLKSFELLLEAGASPSGEAKTDSHYTPIMHIAMSGHVEFLELLLKYDASLLNSRTKMGCTPLWIAIMRNNVDMVSALLRLGASTENIDADNNNALQIAQEQQGNDKMIQVLENHFESREGSKESKSSKEQITKESVVDSSTVKSDIEMVDKPTSKKRGAEVSAAAEFQTKEARYEIREVAIAPPPVVPKKRNASTTAARFNGDLKRTAVQLMAAVSSPRKGVTSSLFDQSNSLMPATPKFILS